MKYYLIAGEASGDLHGANLMKEIKVFDPQASFRFFGGDLMQQAGNNLAKHYREMAFMGAVDVVMNIRTIKRNMDFCKRDILAFSPDVAILIDYPGFNLKIAEFAKQNNLKVFYYISPKIWAWKAWRIKKIKAFVGEMFTIFPFETDFYKKFQYKVNYIGNPLLDEIETFKKNRLSDVEFREKNQLGQRPIVALLPGSRRQEIKLMLPVMAYFAAKYPSFQFVVSGAPSIEPGMYEKFMGKTKLPVIFNQTYGLLSNSYAALVTSGTATLETALLDTPQVVLYKMAGGSFAYKLFKLIFLKVKYVSLPNLVLNTQAVREFVMSEMKLRYIEPEVEKLLNDQEYRLKIIEDYERLKTIMGGPGASERAARKIVELLKQVLD
jgi:lipid-A-disaccharide synthase